MKACLSWSCVPIMQALQDTFFCNISNIFFYYYE